MFAYIKDNEVVAYPVGMPFLRDLFPRTGFPKNAMANPEIRAAYNIVEVTEVAAAESNTHNVSEVTPTLVDGVWTQTWEQTPKNDSEMSQAYDSAMIELRSQRNRLLASSDWTQMADVALTVEDDTAWRDYRKALRDLPAGLRTADDVTNANWPIAPLV